MGKNKLYCSSFFDRYNLFGFNLPYICTCTCIRTLLKTRTTSTRSRNIIEIEMCIAHRIPGNPSSEALMELVKCR